VGGAQFEAEMETLTSISHANICKLLAFSTDGPNRCLVLELCAGGALDIRLACTDRAGPGTAAGSLATAAAAALGWRHRVRIAVEVARALAHLHSQQPPLLHRDMKTANVLLDGSGSAKVADFGTARSVAGALLAPGDDAAAAAASGRPSATHATTALVAGTQCYM
jgi:serine/threonine protein kinase